jgi:hypothetical protein
MTTRNESNKLTNQELSEIADRAAENRRLEQLERLAREAAEQQILQENNRRQRDEIFQRESNNARVLKQKQISEYREKLYATLGSADLPKTFKFIGLIKPSQKRALLYWF